MSRRPEEQFPELPPVPLNRPASAVGWAYNGPPVEQAAPAAPPLAGFNAPFQPAGAYANNRSYVVDNQPARPVSTVPEDAEVLEVMARAQALKEGGPRASYPVVHKPAGSQPGGGKPPVSVQPSPAVLQVLGALGDASGPPGPPASGGRSGVGNKYGMLVPPAAVSSNPASKSLTAPPARAVSSALGVYENRAKEAEQLYGDRACEIPAQKMLMRGCFAPAMAACAAPPRTMVVADGEPDDYDDHNDGGGGSTLSNSLSNLASYFGVGGGDDGGNGADYTATSHEAAARRAAFLANVERKKTVSQIQQQAGPGGGVAAPAPQNARGRGVRVVGGVDPVMAAASYMEEPSYGYVQPPAYTEPQQVQEPYGGGYEMAYEQQGQQWEQQQQHYEQQPVAEIDAAPWRTRLATDEDAAASPVAPEAPGMYAYGAYAPPQGARQRGFGGP